MRSLWKKLGAYEKTVAILFFVFTVFSVGYFVINTSGIYCPVCQKQFDPGETYLWDTRSGDIFSLSNYINKESEVMWFAGKYYVPQEAFPANRCSYARFPYEVSVSPSYCPSHRSIFSRSEYFLVLHTDSSASVCYAVPDTEISISDGILLKKQLNHNLNCWEIEIRW